MNMSPWSGRWVTGKGGLLPPNLEDHAEQNVSRAMSPGAGLLRFVSAMLLRRAEICAIVPGSAPRKHAPPSGAARQERGRRLVAPRGDSRRGFSRQIRSPIAMILSTVFIECIVGSPVVPRITGFRKPWSQYAPIEPRAGTDDRGLEDERQRS
jgi:hypothetical protein